MFRIASIPKKSIMMIKGSRINPFTIQNRSTSFTPNTGSVSNHNNCNWCVINSACRKIAEDEIKKQLTEFEKHFTEFKNVHKVDMQWLKIFSVFGLITGMGLAGCLLKSIDDINTHMHSLDKKLDKKLDGIDKKLDEKFDSIDKKLDEKFDSIDEKFDSIGEKFDSIDKKFDSIGEKFDSIDKKLDSIDKKFDELKALIIQSNKRGWFY